MLETVCNWKILIRDAVQFKFNLGFTNNMFEYQILLLKLDSFEVKIKADRKRGGNWFHVLVLFPCNHENSRNFKISMKSQR